MKKSFLIGAVLLLSLGLSTCKEKIDHLRMATGGRTGTYYSFGSALGQILSNKIKLPVAIRATGASKANIELVDAGEAEIAIVQNDVMDYAWRGIELFHGSPVTGFSAVAALYPEICHIVADPASGIQTVSDLKGKVVSVGDQGSGTEFNARQVLESYGISYNDIKVEHLNFGASADALLAGTIDAFFCIAGIPTQAITDLASVKEITLLDVNELNASMLIRSYPFYSTVTIPAGTYPGFDAEVKTVAVKATLIVNPKLPEDLVYRLTKVLFESLDELEATHEKGSELSRAYAVEGISVPFHPGAAKYHREIGTLK